MGYKSNEMSAADRYCIVCLFLFLLQQAGEPFDIRDFLQEKLRAEDLNNWRLLLEKISTRKADWRIRLQILEWIAANLEDSVYLTPLFDNENLGEFFLAWVTQVSYKT